MDIAGWPVQFLPPADAPEREALEQSVEANLGGVPTRVMTAEHLMAIALRTGRPKDRARLLQFVSERSFKSETLEGIPKRHGLLQRWQQFKEKLIGE